MQNNKEYIDKSEIMDESNVVINEFTPSNIIEYDNKLSNEIIETINQNYNNSKSG